MSLRVRGASGKGGEGRVRTRITTLWRPRSVASCKMSRTLTTRWSSQCCSTSLSRTTSQGAMLRRNCLLVTFACCSVAPSIVAVSLTGTRSTPVYETPKRSTFEIQWRSPHPRSVMDAATSLRQSPSRKLARGFVASIELPAPHRVPRGSSAHVRCLAISFIVSSCSLSASAVARCAACDASPFWLKEARRLSFRALACFLPARSAALSARFSVRARFFFGGA